MKRFNALLLLAVVTQGCGQGADYIAVRNVNTGNISGSSLYASAQQPTTINNVPNSNPNQNPAAEDLYRKDVSGYGQATATFTVSANRVLKMRFYAEAPDTVIQGTGMMPNYGRLAANITVNGKRLASGLISNGMLSARERSVVLDFSDVLPVNSNPAARADVTVVISDVQSDTYCVIQGICNPRSQYVHSLHQWKAHLEVQTDDTEAL